MPKYILPAEELKKVKLKGDDLPKRDPKTGRPVQDPTRGFKSYSVLIHPDGRQIVEVETREEYKELKEFLVKS